MRIIYNYDDFIANLLEAGMTIGGGNAEGTFSLCSYFGESICWHTDNPDTDPWEWKMRVLNERRDIAYGKFFYKKSGFITKEWFPYFYAVRRKNMIFEEAYLEGTLSSHAKRIYNILTEHKELPLHLIKQYGGFTREEKSRFDAAITELQMRMYITMCGGARKLSQKGEEYGWFSTVFCLTEDFFPEENLSNRIIEYEEAFQKIEKQLYSLNPAAKPVKVRKFITG